MWELLTLSVKSIIFWWVCQNTSYFTIEMQDHVIFAYFHGASSLKTHFPWSSSCILHKSMGATSFQKGPCLKPWSFRFNVLSLRPNQTILCLACGESNHCGGSSQSKRINLMTFVASYAGNHGAVNLNGSLVCQKTWSSQSKRINLMACVASYAEKHGAVDLNV